MTTKSPHTTRICAININGIGTKAKSEKSEALRRWIEAKQVDVTCISETNVNWSKLRNKDTLWERTREWFEHRIVGVSYNTTDRKGKHKRQQGGTATLLRDKIAHRHRDNGFDPSGLGRWSWVRIAGKQGCVTRFATVYCPVQTGSGLETVYSQQLTELSEDPTKKFWKDLGEQLLQWRADGEQLIVAGDWNEHIQRPALQEWMALFNLKEAVTSIQEGQPPPTYQRGSDPIDGIFVSEELVPSKSGYLEFGEIPGDHRGIWIDIPNQSVLGYNMNDIPRHKARRLKLDDPRVVQKYLQILDKIFKQNQVFSRLKELKQTCSKQSTPTPEVLNEYEELDKLRYQCMKLAERKCRKFKCGGVLWSPRLQQARDTILFWTLVYRKHKKCHVSTRRILRLKKRLQIKGELGLSEMEIREQISQAYTIYKTLKSQAEELRLTYQEALARAKADTEGGDAVKILRVLQDREKLRLSYKRIGSSIKSGRTSTTKIHVRTSDGFIEVTQMLAMEEYIVRENEEKFHQTEGWSPLLEGRLFEDLGLMGDGPKVQEVLNGTYIPPPDTSEATSTWLQSLKIKDPKQRKWLSTSYSNFQQGWKKVKERTSSGELHFGHFKSAIQSSQLGWVHYTMAMIPMHLGFSPSRWKQGTDVMLLKAPEVFFLDKLRTIVLYEADFNHENKRIGKDAMTAALNNNYIAAEQFSRPGRSAQDNALGKRLVFDHYRFLKLPFGMCACDLKSCYDRVVHTAASLALQRVGVPLPRIKCMFGTIQNLTHHVRTAYGISETSFGGSSKQYKSMPQGLGQGNGAGPTVWSVLSSTVFDVLHTQGYSTNFCSALSLGLLRLCGFSYVDDCDLIADGITIKDVYNKLQGVLRSWDEIMQVNGAAIAPDKCWWYLVDFSWSRGKWSYRSPGAALQLHVRDKDGIFQSLQYLTHDKAKEMVGVHLAPNGKEGDQVQALRQKTEDWAAHIRRSPLDAESVWLALDRTIMKGVQYPLAATNISEADLGYIMAPALREALPRASIVQTFPRTVLYGPVSSQGFGLTDPYVYQHCRHVQDLVTQPWRGTEVGHLITANIEASKLEAGLYGSLFDSPMKITWFNTNHTWLLGTYEFCWKYDIAFDEPGESLQPNCKNDSALMEVFALQGYSVSQLKTLNRCRLYARVISVSDIADGSGQRLHLHPMNKPIRLPSAYKYRWPAQGQPSPSDWYFWLQALRVCLANSGESLTTSLGEWTLPKENSTDRWEAFLGETGNLIMQKQHQWYTHTLITDSHAQFPRFTLDPLPISTPTGPLLRTRIVRFPKYLKVTGFRQFAHPGPLRPSSLVTNVIEENIFGLPDAKWICQWMKLPPNIETLINAIRSGNANAVSDGSYQKEWDLCSAGWIIASPDAEVKGGGIIPGPEKSSSAYRGELGGLLGLVLVIYALEIISPPTSPYTIVVACDGKSALYKALCGSREYFNTSFPCFDLISRIITFREKMTATLIPTHVKGHQDDAGLPLTNLEKLNVRMDKLAKELLWHAHNTDYPVPDALPPTDDALTQVDYKNTPIVSNLSTTLVHHICEDRLRDYWAKRGRFRVNFAEQWIDWDVVKAVMKESSTPMRRFITKWVSHQCAVGKVMRRRQARESGDCPRCGSPDEDTLHVIRCPHTSSRKQWKKSCKQLKRWLRQKQTHPTLARVLYKILRKFGTDDKDDTYVPTGYDDTIQSCINAQSHLGWTSFLEGFITTDWATVQQQFYTSIRSRRTGRRWAIEMSKQVWIMVFQMWNHRNRCLHDTDAGDVLSGIDYVNNAIQYEHSMGLDTLDTVYAPYFRQTEASLLKMTSQKKRNWLSLIRRAREVHKHIYHDKIATSVPLRNWIGLPPLQNGKKKIPSRILRHFSRTGYRD